ncbi:hypothetical protein CE91St36_03230 [Christensenellaceae bacterium]|nr:hypothetical protein CE91St36_03230 [Christensenellaceae bacterium]BDF60174.1 hypothetical protein CE91St37_03240 [Christensenellaceae bacterium]
MMRIKQTASEVWGEYQRGIEYKTGIGLYDTVKRNENFFNGKQWEGVKAPELPKPVFNFLKPVVNYYNAMLISDDIAANIEVMDSTGGNMDMQIDIPKIISTEIDNIMERANVRFKNRKMIRNCAVDGDGCFYIWFDPDAPTGFEYKGEIKVDLIDNTNIYFGDPSNSEPQEQPYIILAYRRLTSQVREEAKKYGVDPQSIVADNESQYMNSDRDNENEYTTVLLKLWKEEGTVWMMKSTESVELVSRTDTGYRLYPVGFMNWEGVKNSYHGVSPITAAIPNQIFVNKLYAMAMIQMQNGAFPKVIYDSSKITKWDGRAGRDIPVEGSVTDAIFNAWRPPDMSGYVSQMIDSTIRYSKDLMGASDAALGNVKPDNTSAIVAVQKAAGMPLDLQRMDFYNFVESVIRIFIDIMRVNYGLRNITLTDEEGAHTVMFDYSALNNYVLRLKIDIGQAAYWSELTQVQTLDNLMDRKILPDALTYLESLPDGYVKNKKDIIEKIKQVMQIQTMQETAAQDVALMQERPPLQELKTQDGLTDSQIADIAVQLMEKTGGEAMRIVEAMQIAEADKERVAKAYEELKNGGSGDALQQMRK